MRVTAHVAKVIPSGLPTTRPSTIPIVTGSLKAERNPSIPPMVTPVEKNAKSGTARPADSGRNRCSKASANPGPVTESSALCLTGMANPRRTPAIVAWIPDECSSAQATTPIGSSTSQAAAGCSRKICWYRCAIIA